MTAAFAVADVVRLTLEKEGFRIGYVAEDGAEHQIPLVGRVVGAA